MRGVHLGLDNSIWLEVAPVGAGAGKRFLVLDERGNPWRTVTLPAAVTRIARASRAAVWAIEEDADGLPSIVRFRVAP